MKRIPYTIVVLLLMLTSHSRADSWGPVKKTEFYSVNRAHMLKIEPHPDWPSKPGHCRATLFRGQKEVWSRHLVNNHAPVRVFVADSGEYVVTMDEWHNVGDLPVVIYGRDGELVRVHSTDSLGLKDDVLHIKMTVSSYWWNENSISFFGPDDEMFFIRLHWGKWIVLELRNGHLFQKEETFFRDDLRKQHEQKWKKLEEYRQKKLAEQGIQMLSSKDSTDSKTKDSTDRKTGALRSSQEKLKSSATKRSVTELLILLPIVALIVAAIWYFRR